MAIRDVLVCRLEVLADKTPLSEGGNQVNFDRLYMHQAELRISISGTAEHCCICIPGCACVERFVDLHAATSNHRLLWSWLNSRLFYAHFNAYQMPIC